MLRWLALTGCDGDEVTRPGRGVDTEPPVASDPGTLTVHRLNNAEYDNTVAELLGTALRPGTSFPLDEAAEGFDNVATAQTMSTLHLELYEAAAEDLIDELFGFGDVASVSLNFEAEGPGTVFDGGSAIEGIGFGLVDEGEVYVSIALPGPGDYVVDVLAWGTSDTPDAPVMELLVDHQTVGSVALTDEPFLHQLAFTSTGGVIDLGFSGANLSSVPGAVVGLTVDRFTLTGPTDGIVERSAAYDRIVSCDPSGVGERPCADVVVRGFAPLAFRRPLEESEVADLMALYDTARGLGLDWEESVAATLRAILLHPDFLFRFELDPDPSSAVARPLNAWELASRLSYFLWSSTPDATLSARAVDGTLLQDDVLAGEVARMLADPRAAALVDNLAGQWIDIRAVDAVAPDAIAYPAFDEDLRASMKEEMTRNATDALLGDGSLADLFTRDAGWMDAGLAAIYGLPFDPALGDWQLVAYGDSGRSGTLSAPGLMTVLSQPNRTSFVRRGQWVLTDVLCTPPPPPPPDVPAFVPDDASSVSDQLALHASAPGCVECHSLIDPLGLPFEHFDPIGAWRSTYEDGSAVVDEATLPDGTIVHGAVELGAALLADTRLPACIAEKVFTYGLGRAPTDQDIATLAALQVALTDGDFRFAPVATALVLSEPFRFRRGEPAEEVTP